MLRNKDITNIQELKAGFTPPRVSADDIFSRFKALKLSGCLSGFKFFKQRGYDFKMVLAMLVSIVVGPQKTVNAYKNSIQGEDCHMGKDVFYRMKNSPAICWRMFYPAIMNRRVHCTGR